MIYDDHEKWPFIAIAAVMDPCKIVPAGRLHRAAQSGSCRGDGFTETPKVDVLDTRLPFRQITTSLGRSALYR